MKNNKGFAITATIYGFLILFLIILLSVLSVMRSQNNRSITISEKIENKLFPNNEIVISSPKENDFSMTTTKGKYYARIFINNNPNDNCYFYIGNDNKITLEDGILKNKNEPLTIYQSNNTITNSNITSVVITKYYTNKGIINIKQNMQEDIEYWKYINHNGIFNVTYNSNDKMNEIKFVGGDYWESIYYPINVEENNNYNISFNYEIITPYQMLNDKGIGYEILTDIPTHLNNSDSLVFNDISENLPNTSTPETTINIEFKATTTGTYYLNFNFGYVEDGHDAITVKLGNFTITES